MSPRGLCQHAGEHVPGCHTVADVESTLDLGEGMQIHYCEPCGTRAKQLADALADAMKDPEFMAQLEEALDRVEFKPEGQVS